MIHYDELFPSINSVEIQDHFINPEKSQGSEYFLQDQVRQSHIETKKSWDRLVVSALSVASTIDPYREDVPDGTVIRAADAACWALGRNCDIRPRLHDKSSGTNRLVDSGSQITVAKKGPNDTLNQSLKLVAVNGSKIDTYLI